MKAKWILSFFFTLLFFLGFAQQNQTVTLKQSSKETNAALASDKEEIDQLKVVNQELKSQLEDLEKEIDVYRGDVRSNLADFHDKITHWLTILGIVFTLLGVILGIATPLFLNAQSIKLVEEKFGIYINLLEDKVNAASSQADSAKNQAEQARTALKDIEEVKNQVDGIEKKVGEASDNVTNQAELATRTLEEIEKVKKHVDEIEKKVGEASKQAAISAKEAYASQIYSEALAEDDQTVALKLFDRVLSMDPNHSSAYYYRGNIKLKQKDFIGAIKDYNKTLELNLDQPKAYNNRGNAKKRMGDHNGALADYNKAIEIDPNHTISFYNRGIVLMEIGNLKEALEDFNKAISFSPEKPTYYRRRAKCFDRLSKKETDAERISEYNQKAEADRKMADKLASESRKDGDGE